MRTRTIGVLLAIVASGGAAAAAPIEQHLGVSIGTALAAGGGWEAGGSGGQLAWDGLLRPRLGLRVAFGQIGGLDRKEADGPHALSYDQLAVGLRFELGRRGAHRRPFAHAGLAIVRANESARRPSSCACSEWETRREHAIAAALVAGAGVELAVGTHDTRLGVSLDAFAPSGNALLSAGRRNPAVLTASASVRWRL